MKSAEDFIDAINAAGVLNDAELADMRRLAAEGTTPVALAAKLVQSGALTNDEASQYLAGSSDSGSQLAASDLLMPGSGSSVGQADALSGWRSSEDVGSGSSQVLDSGIGPAAPKKPPADEGSIVHYDKDYDEALDKSLSDTKVPAAKGGGKRRKHLKKAKSNEFDSPLILIGGGGLVLLILCGLGLAFLLNQESGDELLRAAQESYEGGSYSQAITGYERFVEDFSTHAKWSTARVQLATARLFQAVETARDEEEGLRLAQQEIPEIEDEPAFGEAQSDLASLLMRIAMGLAEEADEVSRGDDPEKVDGLIQKVEATLTLIGNTKYVPKSQRDEGEIDAVRELLVRIDRRRQASQDLRGTLAAMADATDAGRAREAYAAHRALLEKRPEVADDARLTEAIRAAGESERTSIRFVGERVAAETDDRPSPIVASVLVADRRREGAADAEGVFVAVSDGVAYAVRAASGEPLWRRPVGASLTPIDPTPLDGGYLLMDHRHNELLLVDEATGQPRWRAPIGGPANRPLVLGGRVLVATESGNLLSLDAESGERLGFAEFAQPLRSRPAVDDREQRLYVVGEHSSLYTLDAGSLECLGVHYLAHSPGSVVAPPVVTSGRLVVLENVGLDTSVLRLMNLDDEGLVDGEAARLRLEGTCDAPPLVTGRRLMVATRRGEVKLLELAAGAADEPLTVLATRPAGRQKSGPRFLASSADSFWIADVGLTRSAASLADSRLMVQRLAEPFATDAFVGPLTPRGRALLHSRRRKGVPGVTLAATDVRTGEAAWEVDFGAPPLGPAGLSSKPRGLVVANAVGAAHVIGRDATRRGVSDKPTAPASRTTFEHALRLANGTRVLTSVGAAEFVALRLDAPRPSRAAKLDGVLACQPAAMGPGWLAPLEVGQVLLVDARGRAAGAGFQPPLSTRRKVRWRSPAVAEVGGETLAVIADDVDAVYCLALGEDDAGRPSLDERASHRLAGAQPITGLAIAAGRAAVGVSGDKLALFDLPALGEPTIVDVGAAAWGPYAAGDALLLATESGELVAVTPADGRVAWRTPLPEGLPVGAPIADDRGVTLVSDTGVVARFDAATGALAGEARLGQVVGSGAAAYGKRLLVGAADASLLVVESP